MLVENPTRITEAKIKRMAKLAKGSLERHGTRRIPGPVPGHDGPGQRTAHGKTDRRAGEDRGHPLQRAGLPQQFRPGDDTLRGGV